MNTCMYACISAAIVQWLGIGLGPGSIPAVVKYTG